MEPIKMTSEEILKETIKEKYGNVLRFSKAVQIPESSIRNIFNRGVESVSAGVLVKICKALNLDVESLVSGRLSVRPNMQKEKLWAQYAHDTPDLPAEATLGETDVLRSTLLHNYDRLNQEGRERLVETSDDMVTSGKYIKSNPAELGKTKGS